MNKIKTTRSILSAVIVAAALGLVACGGGGSTPDVASVLATGAVGTKGDWVNASEYAAVTCGMTQAQIEAIIADTPSTSVTNVVTVYNFNGISVAFDLPGGLLKQKSLSKGTTMVENTKC
jgi:hypothetical protein